MPKIQFSTTQESDLALLKTTQLAIINNIHCKTKPEQVNLALKWLNEILNTLDEIDLQNILNIKTK